MKLISTLIFLLCVTFAFAECYDNHFDECRIERQNGKYGIVIDKQLAVVDMTASILCMENKMPMLVFGLNEENSIVKAMKGQIDGTKVTV